MKKCLNYFLVFLCAIFVPLSSFNISAKGNDTGNEIVFTEESIEKLEYEMGIDSPYAGQMLTYTVDEDNNIVRVDNQVQPQAVTTMTIAVFVGGAVVGYLTSSVIDGIVISATGQSGGWWVGQAIQNVLNRKYTGRTYISCNVYPMHSYEGAMCRKYE